MQHRISGLRATVLAALVASASAHAATFTTVHLFNGTDGAGANEMIENLSTHMLFGTTQGGGAHFSNGTVFKMTKAGALTTLYSFDGTTGGRPTGALVDGGDGYYYGTTTIAGSLNGGTAFKITPAGVLTYIHQFGGSPGPSLPIGLVSGNDGNLYGVSVFGGTAGYGSIFRMSKTGVVTTLHSFTGADGASPENALSITSGNGIYYGTAMSGGANGCGTFFKITNAGDFTLLYSFPKTAPGGCQPEGRLVTGAGATAETFYGTTQTGGANGKGTVFSITTAGVPTWLHSFAGTTDGALPHGGVTMGNNFWFYGATGSGGANNVGTTFKISQAGVFSVLHTLNPAMPGETTGPSTPWMLDSVGNFYGSTPGYSSSTNGGSIFRQTP